MVELCQIMPDYFFIMPDFMPDLKEDINSCLLHRLILGVPKKIAFWHFQHYQNYLGQNFFYSKNYRQKAISEQVLKIFGGCQNCQN